MPLPYSITLKNATVEFDKGFVCQDINWSIHPEHHWLICGNNGSGKSALAAILTGTGEVQNGIVKNLVWQVFHDAVLDFTCTGQNCGKGRFA